MCSAADRSGFRESPESIPNHGALLHNPYWNTWQLGRYDGSRWAYITRRSKRALLKTHQRQPCTHLDDFPGRFLLHVSHSLLFCCSLNRQKSSSAFRGWDKLACNPPRFRWLFHLYTDSVPLRHPARPCNKSRAQHSFGLIYRLPVLFSASSKQPLETCPQNEAATAVMPLTHASYSHRWWKRARKGENFSGTGWSVLFIPVWFFMGGFLVFLSGCPHHTV